VRARAEASGRLGNEHSLVGCGIAGGAIGAPVGPATPGRRRISPP